MISISYSKKPCNDRVKFPPCKETEQTVVSTLKFPLRLFRLFGLFSFSFKDIGKGELKLNFRLFSISTFWVCFLNLGFATGDFIGGVYFTCHVAVLQKELDVLKTIKALCAIFHTLSIYTFLIYFKVRYHRFDEILVEFDKLIRNLKHTKLDKMLKYFVPFVTFTMLILAVFENGLYVYTLGTTNLGHVGPYSPIKYKPENESSLETVLLSRFNFDWSQSHSLRLFHLYIKILLQAFRSYAWNFVDVLMILLFRLISFRFKALAESALDIAEDYPDADDTKKGAAVWEEIRCDYEQLHGLLKKLNAFLSPPLLLSFTVNVILMAMHLSQWISSKENDGHGVPIYVSMSSFLLILRTVMITHYGSEIHENAHLILTAVERCSSRVYSISMERLERKLATQKIGLDAGGIFFISRTFFASITSVIFTIEIFLLQTGQPSATTTTTTTNP